MFIILLIAAVNKIYSAKKLVKKSFPVFLVSVFIICILMLIERDYIRNEYPRYIKTVKYSGFWPDAAEAWNWLNSNTTGNNIAYVGRPVPFPLYGSNFKNNVYYVSVNRIDPANRIIFLIAVIAGVMTS